MHCGAGIPRGYGNGVGDLSIGISLGWLREDIHTHCIHYYGQLCLDGPLVAGELTRHISRSLSDAELGKRIQPA